MSSPTCCCQLRAPLRRHQVGHHHHDHFGGNCWSRSVSYCCPGCLSLSLSSATQGDEEEEKSSTGGGTPPSSTPQTPFYLLRYLSQSASRMQNIFKYVPAKSLLFFSLQLSNSMGSLCDDFKTCPNVSMKPSPSSNMQPRSPNSPASSETESKSRSQSHLASLGSSCYMGWRSLASLPPPTVTSPLHRLASTCDLLI